MARTVADLELGVRFHSGDNALSLTSATNLGVLNRVYRRMATVLEWPEFLVEDTSLTTVAGQSSYTFPALAATVPVVLYSVEMEGRHGTYSLFGESLFGDSFFGAGSVEYRRIAEPPSELLWADAGIRDAVDWPWYYRRTGTGATDNIEFRPAPATAGRSIRIRGMRQPTVLTGSSSTTEFYSDVADDALEKLFAAEYAKREGFTQVHQEQLTEANFLLSGLFNREVQVL